jgi:autotransporter-associated beta strand protein
VIAGGISSPALAQTTINGDNLALQSSGAASGSGWTLSSNGYVGTYISLTSPAAVTLTANASGVASDGLNPDMTFSIANSTDSFSVASSAGNYTYTTPTLPAGTYFVRTQLDNQNTVTGQIPDLTVNSLTVSGSGVSVLNSSTNTNALNAATSYAQNYRQGPATITLTNGNGNPLGAGTQVQVKLIDNAFNFATEVYGFDQYYEPPAWLNGGVTSPVSATPNTTEEISYQNAILTNFNMIVPANAGKWGNEESNEGSPYMNTPDAMVDFAAQHGLGVRMHNLIWNTEQPSFVTNLFNSNGTISAANKTTLINDINSRINYYVSGNNGALNEPRANYYQEMDVLNEAWHGQADQDNYLGALGYQGVANVYAQVASVAKSVGDTNMRLYTNEYNVLQNSPVSINSTGVSNYGTSGNGDPYANWYLQGVQQIQDDQGPVSGIGMELYVTNTAISPANMQQAMQNLSVDKTLAGNPVFLSLTEFGVSGGSTPSQSVYDTDLTEALTMAYGTPQDTTFGFWGGLGGPNDSNTYTSNGNTTYYSLYNSSYALTPAGTAFQNWMAQWNTNDTLTTNANGQVSFNGTYGIYDVTVNGVVYELDMVPGTTNYGLMTPISNATWNGGGGSNVNWSDSANWTGTLTANAPLVFAGTTSLSPNNDSAAGTEYSSITFNSGAGPFVIGGNAITLGGNIVNNSSNTQTINLPIAIQQNTTFNAASGNITLGGTISGAYSITTSGSGSVTLAASNSYTGATTVSAGTLVVAAAGALPAGSNVSVASGASLVVNANTTSGAITGSGAVQVGTGGTTTLQLAVNSGASTMNSLSISNGSTLDITNNNLIINYGAGADPKATILNYLATGANSGGWNGPGIISSTAAGNSSYGVGYADGADGIDPNLTSGQFEIAYAQYGDITLQGEVNANDFHILASNFGFPTTAGWEAGDFLYQGAVNAQDFYLMASNFGQTETGEDTSIPSSDKTALEAFASANGLALPSNVPEPTGLVALAAIGVLARRRRSRPSI